MPDLTYLPPPGATLAWVRCEKQPEMHDFGTQVANDGETFGGGTTLAFGPGAVALGYLWVGVEHVAKDGDGGLCYLKHPQPGDMLLWREEWWQDSRWPNETVIYASEPEWGMERAEPGELIRANSLGVLVTRYEARRNCETCKWKSIQPAETMPDWAVRHRFTVLRTLRVCRASELTEDEAARCGVKLEGDDWGFVVELRGEE